MNCPFCGNSVSDGATVWLPQKTERGWESIRVCKRCAAKSPHYCQKHTFVHGLFDEEHSACEICAAEIFEKQKYRTGETFKSLRQELPPEQFDRLYEWVAPKAFKANEENETWVLKALIACALLNHTDIDKIMEKVIKRQLVDLVMPPEL